MTYMVERKGSLDLKRRLQSWKISRFKMSRWRIHKRRKAASWSRWEAARGISLMRQRMALQSANRPPRCPPHEHDWSNEDGNPEWCLRCGMSFTAYTHMECP